MSICHYYSHALFGELITPIRLSAAPFRFPHSGSFDTPYPHHPPLLHQPSAWAPSHESPL